MLDAVTWLAAAVAVIAVLFAARATPVAGAVTLPAGAALVAMVFTDVRRHRLPARWIDVAAATTVTALAVDGWIEATDSYLAAAVVIAAGTWVFWWLLRVVTRNGLGYGDVRLATMAALPLGALSWTAGLLFTPAVFVAAAAFLVPLRPAGRHGRLPLAPAIAVAWSVTLLLLTASAGVPFNHSGSLG
jgi:leader peptidase (prepilin peptidase)/N-methyltransferase